ncbi:CDP-diacylglycerol--serine O-phosphatidyltransferase [Rosenbergiella australiborealis]|uniref:CDP-diacylglycerol--serine O-phosphatidyltransferase n=1 Tax=Rosenbergiella australiborealis TaxID=1544696 RepID=A0ABS5T7R6_9GAMM|nr:CDP-diacylglycerol--serine O-phosphatidyltransferase [Rosenbergiella australiborealis]MBT0728361.1 CDP-diacylglycerol--serine O-phosphatidyltransferase [Rosenbergiella australiborealis]
MLSKIKMNSHQRYLAELPKLPQSITDFSFLYSAAEFHHTLLDKIAQAQYRICLVALYLENDEAGQSIMNALYQAKQHNPQLDISICVDWHRAQRGRIGAARGETNADWYCQLAEQAGELAIPVFGIPVNTREALGVLHLKGFIFDDTVLYSGASINNVYLQQDQRYRYDRYQVLKNPTLAGIMFDWINSNLKQSDAVHRLDLKDRPTSLEIKSETKIFRQELRTFNYEFDDLANEEQLSVTPLAGLGKRSLLNQTIFHLMPATEKKLVICTPYFNLPAILVRHIIRLLRQGKEVEIIVGDKTANDFYIPPEEPFKIIGALPYLYEINLRRFASRLQYYLDNDRLTIRLWQDGTNSYHLKGIWVDEEWMLLTGNNLNPRAWRLDLENAILVHDPQHQLAEQKRKELTLIREHTTILKQFHDLESIAEYPNRIKKLIRRLRRIRIDKLISRIL